MPIAGDGESLHHNLRRMRQRAAEMRAVLAELQDPEIKPWIEEYERMIEDPHKRAAAASVEQPPRHPHPETSPELALARVRVPRSGRPIRRSRPLPACAAR